MIFHIYQIYILLPFPAIAYPPPAGHKSFLRIEQPSYLSWDLPQSREYILLELALSWVHLVVMVFSAQLAEGVGVLGHPFQSTCIYPLQYSDVAPPPPPPPQQN